MGTGGPAFVQVRRLDGVVEELGPAASVAPVPVLFDSPHSGRTIPPDFVTPVSLAVLRSGEDAFVDELVSGCFGHGIGLIRAEFPRTYIDVNRAIDDIDEALLDAPWPGGANPTDKSRRGFGLIRREILGGIPMYDRLLRVEEVERRITAFYRPYHEVVGAALDRLHAGHGAVWHVDWHSMKPIGAAMNVDAGQRRPDIVVSDLEGRTADKHFTEAAAGWFAGEGFDVSVNAPYKGAEMVRRHGNPDSGRHSIQIEINRDLYLDPASMTKTENFTTLKASLDAFCDWLARYVRAR